MGIRQNFGKDTKNVRVIQSVKIITHNYINLGAAQLDDLFHTFLRYRSLLTQKLYAKPNSDQKQFNAVYNMLYSFAISVLPHK